MTRRLRPRCLPRSIARVAQLLAAVTVLAILVTPTLHGDSGDCEGIVIPDGCLVTITGGDTAVPDDGYAVTDAAGIPFWTYYQRQGPHVLGYPISQRFIYHGIVYQAFQKAILQWQHWEGRIAHLNTLDVLEHDYPQVRFFSVPPHQWLPADESAPFEQVKANHLALLDANPTIRDYFLATPNWLDRFGLPIAYAVMHGGDLEVLRTQRAVLSIWLVPVAGVTVGSVNLSNVGDDIKKLTNVLIPDGAEGPVSAAEASNGLVLAALPLQGDQGPNEPQQETSTPPPQPEPEPVQPNLTGPGLSGYGIQGEYRWFETGGPVDLVWQAGLTWVKQQVTWADVEIAPNQFNWDELDQFVRNATSRGRKILMGVIKAPPFYKPAHMQGTSAGPPSDLGKFRHFMWLLASRYRGKVQAYEIWNEPNLNVEWGPLNGNSHVEYYNMLRNAYEAIKEADPGAVVVTAGLTPTGVVNEVAIDDRVYLQRLISINDGDIRKYFDALGIHANGGPNAPDDTLDNPANSLSTCNGDWSTHPSFFFNRYQQLYQDLVDAGITGKTVWITEVGWAVAPTAAPGFGYATCNTEDAQARFLVRAFEKVREETTYVTHMFIWNLNFQQIVPSHDERWAFGIVRQDGSPRPAYTAVQQMSKP